jgi:hypothetical protein
MGLGVQECEECVLEVQEMLGMTLAAKATSIWNDRLQHPLRLNQKSLHPRDTEKSWSYEKEKE